MTIQAIEDEVEPERELETNAAAAQRSLEMAIVILEPRPD